MATPRADRSCDPEKVAYNPNYGKQPEATLGIPLFPPPPNFFPQKKPVDNNVQTHFFGGEESKKKKRGRKHIWHRNNVISL